MTALHAPLRRILPEYDDETVAHQFAIRVGDAAGEGEILGEGVRRCAREHGKHVIGVGAEPDAIRRELTANVIGEAHIVPAGIAWMVHLPDLHVPVRRTRTYADHAGAGDT